MNYNGHLLKISWGVFSLALISLFLIARHYQTGETFFIMLNSFNIVLIILYLLFRRKISEGAHNINRLYREILSESALQPIQTERQRSPAGIFLIVITICIGLYVSILSVIDINAYSLLIQEDGIIEYASSIFWFLAAALTASYFIKNKPQESRALLHFAPRFFLITFFIICGGEEISWGQRIFDLETPEALKAVNVQNEITLHNIGSISVFSNAFFAFAGVFFLLWPYINHKNHDLREFSLYCGLPLPNRYAVCIYALGLVIWLFIGIRFGTLGFHPFSFYADNYYTQMDDEMFEFLAAFAFFCFSTLDVQQKPVPRQALLE